MDGDTSTNDMALVMASGAATSRPVGDGADYAAFREALTEAARQLAMMIVREGEGVTRVASKRFREPWGV